MGACGVPRLRASCNLTLSHGTCTRRHSLVTTPHRHWCARWERGQTTQVGICQKVSRPLRDPRGRRHPGEGYLRAGETCGGSGASGQPTIPAPDRCATALCQNICARENQSRSWNWHTRVPAPAAVVSHPHDCGSISASRPIIYNNYSYLHPGTPVALSDRHGDPQLFACSFGSGSVLRHAGTPAWVGRCSGTYPDPIRDY